jgi:hypothetical protein
MTNLVSERRKYLMLLMHSPEPLNTEEDVKPHMPQPMLTSSEPEPTNKSWKNNSNSSQPEDKMKLKYSKERPNTSMTSML